MSVTASTTFPRASIGWSIVLSVLMIVAGVLAIAMPLAAAIAVNIFVAWMLMFSGAAHLVFAWYRRHSRGFIWQFLLGILYAFIGAYILINPALGLVSLALAIAAYLLLEGVLEITLAFQLDDLEGMARRLRTDHRDTRRRQHAFRRYFASHAQSCGASRRFGGTSLTLFKHRRPIGPSTPLFPES
jgi:hypothetical protein